MKFLIIKCAYDLDVGTQRSIAKKIHKKKVMLFVGSSDLNLEIIKRAASHSNYYIQLLVVQQIVYLYIMIVRSKELLLYFKFVQYIK